MFFLSPGEVDREVKESERKFIVSVRHNIVQGFYTRKLCIIFFSSFCLRKIVIFWLSFFSLAAFSPFNVTSPNVLFLLFSSVSSSQFHLLFNVSHRASRNVIGSQKQHFHFPLFSFTSKLFFCASLYYYCCRRLRGSYGCVGE
jgi:hypothetical protein